MGRGVVRLYERGASSFFPFRIFELRVADSWDLLRPADILKEASDLHLRAGERVLVTEQSSSDWCACPKLSISDPKYSSSYPRWTGEVDGRSGLFPASYVKLL